MLQNQNKLNLSHLHQNFYTIFLHLKSILRSSLKTQNSKKCQFIIKDMKSLIKLLLLCLIVSIVVSDTAIVTYHLYKSTDALTTVACSDGANGIMSWGYKDISLLFPYVTAWQGVRWNSPQCGSCVQISWKGKFVYVTVIDRCEVINPLYSHFDMSKQAFTTLFGQQGIYKGTMTANFSIVSSKLCKGNRKNVGFNPYIHLQSPQQIKLDDSTSNQPTENDQSNQNTYQSQDQQNYQDLNQNDFQNQNNYQDQYGNKDRNQQQSNYQAQKNDYQGQLDYLNQRQTNYQSSNLNQEAQHPNNFR